MDKHVMRRIGLLHHPKIPQSVTLAKEAGELLSGLGRTVWHSSSWDEEEVLKSAHESDLLVTFGGDGTIVRVARTTAGHDLPILGVNLGRLGFLAEVQPRELSSKLGLVANGEYWIEQRMMLAAQLVRDEHMIKSFEAVNDVVMSRGRIARVVRVNSHVDGEFLTQYVADGVIVATPTGSTAYALAAGGPILDPRLSVMLLKPVAPHLTAASALVVPGEARVRLELSTEYEASISIDGQIHLPIRDGDVVEVTCSRHVCRFLRLGNHAEFYRTLLERLCWPDERTGPSRC
jgi:NAD+ kinase